MESEPMDIGDDDDQASEQLHDLSELLFQAASEIENIDTALNDPAKPPKPDLLKEFATRIPILDGNVDKLQLKVDNVGASSSAARARRRELTEQSTALSERVHGLPAKLMAAVDSAASTHKEAGNAAYKRGDFDAAIKAYTDAISVDRKNATFFSNRCACYQAKSMWTQAVADARECLSLDVSYAKGYKHLVYTH